ncbi:hypothetical protein OG458_08160 [Streptomyces sp. NBC_01281]|uniref:hypothetical protein n=1 Tax=Streptomyces sp. NBC_01281 TaxID=2903811 RepID=UPI002E107D2C|nr:hypothetical protein OG458_08160 [Streptomyces sp. NBC_01281]
MSPRTTGGLDLVRSSNAGKPTWTLVGTGALAHARTDHIHTTDLEATTVDKQLLRSSVEDVMESVDRYSATLAATPSGAGWLHVQHVPVRRFVAEIVRKLLALNSWAPFASAPGPLTLAPYEGLVGLRSSSSREYLAYTVTWSGVAYVLGAAAPHNPTRSAQLRNRARTSTANTEPSPLPSDLGRQDVLALSWTSRHAATLTPVLAELARGGQRSLLLDLATDAAERCSAGRSSAPSRWHGETVDRDSGRTKRLPSRGPKQGDASLGAAGIRR